MAGDPAVRLLQQTLQTLGFRLVGEPDGFAGAKTRLALREFQHYANLPVVACLRTGAPAGRWIDQLKATPNTVIDLREHKHLVLEPGRHIDVALLCLAARYTDRGSIVLPPAERRALPGPRVLARRFVQGGSLHLCGQVHQHL